LHYYQICSWLDPSFSLLLSGGVFASWWGCFGLAGALVLLRLVLLLEVNVWLLLWQFDIEEHDHTCDVVDDVVLLLLPLQVGFAYHGLGCFLRVFALVVRQDNLGDVVVAQELPNTVTCKDNEAVVRAEIELKDF